MKAKNILILTVYNSENCGSFLQAYSLFHVLDSAGYDVAFVKRPVNGTSHDLKKHLIKSIKHICKFRFNKLINLWRTYFSFEFAYKLIRIKKNEHNDVDLVIIGSDTLWNFNTSYFKKNAPMYHGLYFPGKKIITYGISSANTSVSEYQETINSFKDKICISKFLVRDNATKDIVEDTYNCPAFLVCDPTLLLNPSDFSPFIKDIDEPPFMLIYYFGAFDEEDKQCVLSFAKQNNLKIISFGVSIKWSDKSIIYSPENMLTYFSKAACILTNTFHGTIFSILFNRPFAVHNEGKSKITNLLNSFDLTNRYFKDYSLLAETIRIKLPEDMPSKCEKIRAESLELLFGAINEEGKSAN